MNMFNFPISRREMLCRSGMGFGALGLANLLAAEGELSANPQAGNRPAANLSPLAPRQPHFPGKAKRVIHLFMNGGPSHVDTFDPKPALARYAGQAVAARESAHRAPHRGRLSLAVSLSAGTARAASRSARCSRTSPAASTTSASSARCTPTCPTMSRRCMLMNCGDARQIRPSLGSWVTYGLGSENQNLPGFIAMCPGGYPIQEIAELAVRVSARRLPGHLHRHPAHSRWIA